MDPKFINSSGIVQNQKERGLNLGSLLGLIGGSPSLSNSTLPAAPDSESLLGVDFESMAKMMRKFSKSRGLQRPSLQQYELILGGGDSPEMLTNNAIEYLMRFPDGEVDLRAFARSYGERLDRFSTLLREARSSKIFTKPIPQVVVHSRKLRTLLGDIAQSASPNMLAVKEASAGFYWEAGGLHEDFHSGNKPVASQAEVHAHLHGLCREMEIFLKDRPVREFLDDLKGVDTELLNRLKQVAEKMKTKFDLNEETL